MTCNSCGCEDVSLVKLPWLSQQSLQQRFRATCRVKGRVWMHFLCFGETVAVVVANNVILAIALLQLSLSVSLPMICTRFAYFRVTPFVLPLHAQRH